MIALKAFVCTPAGAPHNDGSMLFFSISDEEVMRGITRMESMEDLMKRDNSVDLVRYASTAKVIESKFCETVSADTDRRYAVMLYHLLPPNHLESMYDWNTLFCVSPYGGYWMALAPISTMVSEIWSKSELKDWVIMSSKVTKASVQAGYVSLIH